MRCSPPSARAGRAGASSWSPSSTSWASTSRGSGWSRLRRAGPSRGPTWPGRSWKRATSQRFGRPSTSTSPVAAPPTSQREKMTPEEAVALIRRFGGVPVLAHPTFTNDPPALVASLAAAGLAGMEVYYKNYAPDVVAELKALADRHNLLALGGSDYHAQRRLRRGPPRPSRPPPRERPTPPGNGPRVGNAAKEHGAAPVGAIRESPAAGPRTPTRHSCAGRNPEGRGFMGTAVRAIHESPLPRPRSPASNISLVPSPPSITHLDIIILRHHDVSMRTTLTLDDDIADSLKGTGAPAGPAIQAGGERRPAPRTVSRRQRRSTPVSCQAISRRPSAGNRPAQAESAQR